MRAHGGGRPAHHHAYVIASNTRGGSVPAGDQALIANKSLYKTSLFNFTHAHHAALHHHAPGLSPTRPKTCFHALLQLQACCTPHITRGIDV
eukprot:XP_001702286.1 predicted protein [Chlamydomonas reinhardtii]